MKRVITIIVLFLVFIFSTSWQNDGIIKSRVKSFKYLGNGDTTVALIGGFVFEKCYNKKCKLKEHPVMDVIIKNQNGVYLTRTDKNGKFGIGILGSPKFGLLIEKNGYQTLRISNVNGKSDEQYWTIIYLEKGKETAEYIYSQE